MRQMLQAHFFIYKNLAYVSEQRFTKERISIGSSPDADVILQDRSIADIHALVHLQDGRFLLSNKYPNDGLRLNGRSVRLETLQHEDVIDIGPFSLKIKMRLVEKEPVSSTEDSYSVVLINRYDSDAARNRACGNLARMLRTDAARIRPLIEKDQFIIKKMLDAPEAMRWRNALLKAGVVHDFLLDGNETRTGTRGHSPEFVFRETAEQRQTVHVEDPGSGSQEAKPSPAHSYTVVEDDEDDEDELWEAPFSLRQKLTHAHQSGRPGEFQNNLQIVKAIGSSVIDVELLSKRQKYFMDADQGRICLARFHPKRSASVNITPQMRGYVKNERGQVTADLDSYKTADYAVGRGSRQLYRLPVPHRGAVVVEDADCSYTIMLAPGNPSPEVAVASVPGNFTWRHWAYSAGMHLFFLLCISVVLYFQAVAPKPQSPRFVKIDPSLIKKLESLKAPEPPKVEPPPPKPEPVKVAEKLEPPKPKPVKKKTGPIRRASRSKAKHRKAATTAAADRHPNAGGGFGRGNIKNRNINQTGILSVLGTNTIGGPSEAVAAVTNLDAVPVPGAGEKNFTVGGLKGSLGNGRISVATGEIVQTKGSQKVLRSAGARGKGDVAALERGTTGKRQVQAMVTAKMSRTVKIEGGMSREMVKRVIDQHLQEITFCYETALMSNPSILGRIVFEWKILMDGSVGEIRIVASSINSHEIHDCIKSAIKSWRFPKPQGTEVIVSYPFVFDLVAF